MAKPPSSDPLAGTVGRKSAGEARKARRGLFAPRFRRRVRKPGARAAVPTAPLDGKVRELGVRVYGPSERAGELGGYLARGNGTLPR